MWLVDKLHAETDPHRDEIPSDISAAIIRWYVGSGSQADETAGVALVRKAKLFDRWIACDCLGHIRSPPLLSPAYLSEAQTYYLRRLTGEGRPEHDRDCPFHRDRSDWQIERDKPEAKPVRPDGLFATLKPISEHLAQQPDDGADNDRVRGPSTPRLARLLWTLLDVGRTNIIEAAGDRPKPSITLEFDALRAAAANFWIAPGKPLLPLLFTHPQAFHTRRVHAMLREAAATWPDGHEPQAFLALYAQSVTRREIVAGNHDEPIIIASDIIKPAAWLVDRGPYLVFVAIGHLAQAHGFVAVRAYAQPIQSGRQFVPVNSNAERAFLAVLLDLQWSLHRSGITLRIKKPIFDEDTELGPCRPDFLVEITERRSGRQRLQLFKLLGYDEASTARAETITIPRMESIGPVAQIRISDLNDDATLRDRLVELLRL